MRIAVAMLIAFGAIAGCTDDAPAGTDGGTATTDADPSIDARVGGDVDSRPGCAAVPTADPTWLTSYQQDIVAKLSGQTAIRPGVYLSDRATVSNRNEARTFLQNQLTALGYTARLQSYAGGANPYAILEASSPSSSNIIIGAHFDSVPGGPGANDNATGVAAVLAVARYLQSVDCRQSNVYFVLFDEEEVGLVGSFEFAKWLSQQSINVVSVHTIDQMGWDSDGDRAIELERPDGNLYVQYVQTKSAAGLTMPLYQTGTGATDHVSFRPFGFAAIGLTEEYVNGDTTPYYHTSNDTYDTVNFAYLRSTTVLANAHFARLARMSAAAFGPPATPRAWPPSEAGHAMVRALGCRAAYAPARQ